MGISKYWIYYTSLGDPRQLAMSTTDDLEGNQWTHNPDNPILAHKGENGVNGKNKDCTILKEGDQWIMYYSMVTKQVNGKDYWVVGYSTSHDLLDWSQPQIAFDQSPSLDPGVESPFVIKRGKGSFTSSRF